MERPDAEKDLSSLGKEEKTRWLFERQKALLDTFLGNHAITPAQYRKSLGDLRLKMGFPEENEKGSEE